MARRKVWRQKTFIDAFKLTGTDTHACDACGVDMSTLGVWKKTDAAFMEKYNEAQGYITDLLKRSGLIRATSGYTRPIYQGGQKVGEEKVYSDRCWEILLKARDKSFRGLDDISQLEISKAVDEIVAKVQMVINKALPQTCPHCKNLLGLRENIVKELEKVSGVMGMPTK